jgi:hypothetical protein
LKGLRHFEALKAQSVGSVVKEEALLERMVARLAVDVRNSGGLVKEFAVPDLVGPDACGWR